MMTAPTILDISFASMVALCAAAVSSLILLSIVTVRWWLLRNQLKHEQGEKFDYSETLPGVSIVIYAHNGAEFLQESLPFILRQDYPEFEVIVVNEASDDDTDIVVSELIARFPNLHLTFAPKGMQNVSRRKLALMLGIKAAKYDIILTTNSNCHPTSLQWLRLMMRNFIEETDVVIGYSHPHYRHDKDSGSAFRAYDIVCDSVPYLASAVAHHPYRGISDNLAYRKRCFFDNKGFSKSANLHHGDDDLFVREIVNGENTRVVIERESQIVADYYNYPFEYKERKMHYGFTSRFMPRMPYLLTSLTSWMHYAVLAGSVCAVALEPANKIVWGVAAAIVLITWIVTAVMHCGNAKRLGAPYAAVLVPIFALWRPWHNLYYRYKIYKTRSYNYTWRKELH